MLTIFLLAGFLVQAYPASAVTETIADILKMLTPLPDCPPDVTGRLDHGPEIDNKGNKLEIWCEGGQYLMKFIKADGSGGYVGKCPFPYGDNRPAKRVRVIIRNDSGVITIEEDEILQTFWESYDAPTPSEGSGTDRPDRIWIYDVKSNLYFRQNTKHDGDWVFVDEDLIYNVSNVRNDGGRTDPQNPPSDPNDLIVIGDPPPEDYILCEANPQEYEMLTPVPVTSINEIGILETKVYKIPYGEELVSERIYAIESKPFIFDIQMPGEKVELVTYSLLNAPSGMYINPVNGVIQWTPDLGQIGNNNIAVLIGYNGLSSDINQFVLEVLPKCALADFNHDNRVNFRDIAGFSANYGRKDCSATNNWCNGADFNNDGRVNAQDIAFFSGCYGQSW